MLSLNGFRIQLANWVKSFSVAVFLSIALVYCVSNYFDETENKITYLEKSYKTVLYIKEMESGLLNMETGARGFFLYRKVEFLEPQLLGKNEFTRGYEGAEKTIDPSSRDRDVLDRIKTLKIQWANAIETTINNSSKEGLSELDYQKIITSGGASRKDYMDALRKSLLELEDNRTEKIQEDTDNFAKTRSTWRVLSVILMSLLIFTFYNFINEIKKKELLVKTLNRQLSVRPE